MSKTIKLVMIFSVVLNILLIGFIIGNVSHRFFINNSVREKPQEISVLAQTNMRHARLSQADV